jgi:hypothetical protein
MLFTESSYSNRQPVDADVKFSREKDRALKWQFVELLFQWHLVASTLQKKKKMAD